MRFVLLLSLFCSSLYAGPVVLVTGASRGIVLAITETLVKDGYTVYAGVRDVEKKYPKNFRVLELDVTNQLSVERAFKTIMDSEGRIDVLVNNAGIMMYGSVENHTIDEAKKYLM